MTDAAPVESVVVCSILEGDAESTRRAFREVPEGSTLLEIRADALRAEELPALVRAAPRPTIVTIRRRGDGGRFDGSEEERRRGLLGALEAGARFIDVEWESSLRELALGERADRVILSLHGLACRTPELRGLYREMAGTSAARLKIVPVATLPAEIVAVRELLAEAARDGRPLAAFATGRAGAVSRLFAPSWGSWATFGPVRAGAETAPGQFPARDLLELHDVLHISSATRRFALVGRAVFGSPSPAMHRAGHLAARFDARYFPLELDQLDDCLPLLGASGALAIEGLAVTLPFKREAASRSTLADAVSQASGAVNTVLVGAAGWRGYNTDGPAILALVRRHLDPAGRRAAIVGAGGTAWTAAAVLRDAGAEVTVYNRTLARAVELGRSLQVAAAGLDELPRASWDILIQSTPLGAAGEELLAPAKVHGSLVLDAAYGAGEPTPLVRAARERRVPTIDGLELLAAQAELQFERLTGLRPGPETLGPAGRQWLARRAASAPRPAPPMS